MEITVPAEIEEMANLVFLKEKDLLMQKTTIGKDFSSKDENAIPHLFGLLVAALSYIPEII